MHCFSFSIKFSDWGLYHCSILKDRGEYDLVDSLTEKSHNGVDGCKESNHVVIQKCGLNQAFVSVWLFTCGHYHFFLQNYSHTCLPGGLQVSSITS